ncbi:MAG: leucine--tRNA ligase [Pseudomonadota bacterium]
MTSERYNHRTAEQENLAAVSHFIKRGTSSNKDTSETFYCLEMFPYPSGKIHMGHIRNYTLGDVLARMKFAKGYDVLHPMGWDAFGLPAENAAKEKNIHPQSWTLENIANMKMQLKRLGLYIDWSSELATCLPEYYGAEQRIFLEFLKHGIAYKKEAAVNWDPVDQTVLANEQVIDGRGWRSGALVEKKKLNQWFLKISDFADELLEGLKTLKDWPEKVLLMQEKWIGKSIGVEFSIPILSADGENICDVSVFTTRHETIFGMSYVALSIEHDLIKKYAQDDPDLQAFCKICAEDAAKADYDAVADKKGYRTALIARNPLSGEEVPVYAANYVLSDYGSGAVFGCPAHDERDYEFAQKYNINICQVILAEDDKSDALPYTEKAGKMINSGSFDGLDITDARKKILETLQQQKVGSQKTTYRLRDWGVSRQRYWGCPIPVINCPSCGAVPVPEDQLPVTLPEDVDFNCQGNPLAAHPTWKYTKCPDCGADAERDTDTLDTFFDSSWYFMRFLSPKAEHFIDREAVNKYLPVDQYIGGIEHAVLHLLYARFMTRALCKIGAVDVQEPFKALFTQGMVCHATYKSEDGRWLEPVECIKKDGQIIEISSGRPVTMGPSIKMSKSKKNIVDPDEIIQRYGADTARWFVLSDSPPEKDVEWTEEGVEAAYKFMQKLWVLLSQSGQPEGTATKETSHKIMLCLKEYDAALEKFAFNKAIAKIYEIANIISSAHKKNQPIDAGIIQNILICLYAIIPFLAMEIYKGWDYKTAIQDMSWPDMAKISDVSDEVTVAVQVLGKLRGTLLIPANSAQDFVEQQVHALPVYDKYIRDKTVKKIIYVPNKIINYVVI